MKKWNKIKQYFVATCIAIVGFISVPTNVAFANSEFSVSPMRQKIVLTRGEKYTGSFDVINPSSNKSNISYTTTIKPFYISDEDEVIFENNGDYTQMVDWITVRNENDILSPNSTKTIFFDIDVPQDAPAGGQYATIVVTADEDEAEDNEGSLSIHNVLSIAHIVYAEVAGSTNRTGEIINTDVPGFLISGDLSASGTIKNNGNVHGTGRYTLQVFPLFSDEEIYTNEENPAEKTILPGQQSTNIIYYPETPLVGIFNVIYTVEFEGKTTQVSKMVIKCPIWLLFIIIFIILALFIWLMIRVRSRGKKAHREKVNRG